MNIQCLFKETKIMYMIYVLNVGAVSVLVFWSLEVVNKHQNDKPLLMSRYMTVFHILFCF